MTFQHSAASAALEQDFLLLKPILSSWLWALFFPAIFTSQKALLPPKFSRKSLSLQAQTSWRKVTPPTSASLLPPSSLCCDSLQSFVRCSLIWLWYTNIRYLFFLPGWGRKPVDVFCVSVSTTLPKTSLVPGMIFAERMNEQMKYNSFAISYLIPVYFSLCFIHSFNNHKLRTWAKQRSLPRSCLHSSFFLEQAILEFTVLISWRNRKQSF